MSLVLAAASSVQMQHHHWSWKRTFAKFTITRRVRLAYRLLNVKAPVGTFNKEKVLVGAFSVIVKSSWTFVSSSNTDAASPLFIHCTGPLFSAPGPLTISRWTHHGSMVRGKTSSSWMKYSNSAWSTIWGQYANYEVFNANIFMFWS